MSNQALERIVAAVAIGMALVYFGFYTVTIGQASFAIVSVIGLALVFFDAWRALRR